MTKHTPEKGKTPRNGAPQHSGSSHAPKVVELHAKGLGCNAIARELDVAPSTVSRIAKDLGLSFDRSQTQAAVAAHQVDNAERRQNILAMLYEESEAKLTELRDVRLGVKRWQTVLRGEFGVEQTNALTYVPARDYSQVAQSVGYLATHAAKLEQVDNPAGKAAVSLLSALAGSLGVQDVPADG